VGGRIEVQSRDDQRSPLNRTCLYKLLSEKGERESRSRASKRVSASSGRGQQVLWLDAGLGRSVREY